MYKAVGKSKILKRIFCTLNNKRLATIKFIIPGAINKLLPSPRREASIQNIPIMRKMIDSIMLGLICKFVANAP
ncbi:MAG: hypothetical protein QW372_06485 [Nitrososphaerales archaeon]